MPSLNKMAEAMNALDMVRWDRCTRRATRATAFGWIDREDGGRADFVVIFWHLDTVAYVTSSARYSRRIGELLRFPPGGHRDCERVEDVFAGLVARVCRAGPKAPAPEQGALFGADASNSIGGRCPACDSPSPDLQPAPLHEGHLQPMCRDAYHLTDKRP